MKSANHVEQPQEHEEPPDTPFGEEITNPDSRSIPLEFHGEWVRDLNDCHAGSRANRTVISSGHVVVDENAQNVVAVRFIDAGKIAVVTLPADLDRKEYSLFYFGVSEDGNSLFDLESMDWVLHRCPAKLD